MKKIRFVRDEQEQKQVLKNLKQTRCAHCRRTGTLNRHDRIQGNDLETVDKQTVRGQRVWCSNRGRRGGCGRTMRIVCAGVLPRHSVSALMLGDLLKRLCGGGSIQSAWEQCRLPVHVQSVYHLLQRFRARLDAVRVALLARCAPPGSGHADPLRQTAEHLRCAFPGTGNPVEAFQLAFQVPIMG
jgi:hypothetical protein